MKGWSSIVWHYGGEATPIKIALLRGYPYPTLVGKSSSSNAALSSAQESLEIHGGGSLPISTPHF